MDVAAQRSHSEFSILTQQVSKHFAQQSALKNLTANIRKGCLTGLVGPDGAGKTTLLRLMAGLMSPSEGKIQVLGYDTVVDQASIASLIGYMPQRFGLYEDLTVMENLKLYSDLRRLKADAADENFEQLLHFTRLGPFTERLAGRLSGGMKQKLGLACTLIGGPKILLLDEPGVGVDPVSRQELWRMVEALTLEGVAVVWATAYLDEAERCEEVILLNEGRALFQGPPNHLIQNLVHRTYCIENPNGDRRAILHEALHSKEVCDGVIQGDSIRLILSDDGTIDALTVLAKKYQGQLIEVSPRFEDSFIELLGGSPSRTSALAERMQPVRLSMETAVECKNLSKRFGRFTATDQVSFKVRPGEIFGLLGPNGAGKSTTFKMLCGLLRPSEGEALVVGIDLKSAASRAKSHLGYMAQKFSLYGLLAVRENLSFSAGVYGLAGQTRSRRINDMVDIFQLGPYLDATPDELPLGFKQRLALACAVMHEPPVLFLDEPTSGVDPITRREFWTHINGIVRKGVTVLVTTHFMDEAEYCDRVALMVQSRMIALDTPDGLKRQAKRPNEPIPNMEMAFIRLTEAEEAQARGRGGTG